jgi:hypothetical protein
MNYEFGEMKGARRRSKRETVVKSGNQERRNVIPSGTRQI